ncbi:MAG: AraC family transcriptional regulator [Clostridiaceae bacterium]|nr:AraC family transcriptional regulator [Clostridiaceae bacterium]
MEFLPFVLEAGQYTRPGTLSPSEDRMVMDYEFDLFTSGDGHITVDGVPYGVPYGTLMLRRPGQRCHSDGAYSCHTLTLDFSGHASGAATRHRTGEPEPPVTHYALNLTPPVLRPEPYAVYEELFTQVRFCFRTGYQAGYDSLLSEFLHRLAADARRMENHRAGERENAALHPSVRALMERMAEHYDERMTLEYMGQTVGLHPHYLHGLFRAQLGMTPAEYLTRVRMMRAARLLLDTTEPVERIAEVCGYSGAAYFSDAFRRFYGVSPRGYRKRLRA